MVSTLSRVLSALTLAVILYGCKNEVQTIEPNDLDDDSILSARMLAENIDSYVGFQVRARGFLITDPPELNLTIDETGASRPDEPYVIITDTSLTSRGSGSVSTAASVIEGLGCTNQFVEIKGIVGETIRGVKGIVYIISIDILGDGRQNVASNCYLAAASRVH